MPQLVPAKTSKLTAKTKRKLIQASLRLPPFFGVRPGDSVEEVPGLSYSGAPASLVPLLEFAASMVRRYLGRLPPLYNERIHGQTNSNHLRQRDKASRSNGRLQAGNIFG